VNLRSLCNTTKILSQKKKITGAASIAASYKCKYKRHNPTNLMGEGTAGTAINRMWSKMSAFLPQTVFVAECVKPNIFFKALNYIPILAHKNKC
jgi:hypothetical protein